MRHTGPLPSRAGRRSVSGLFFLFARAQETNRTDRIKSFFVEAVEPAETVENPEPAPPAAPTAGKTGKKRRSFSPRQGALSPCRCAKVAGNRRTKARPFPLPREISPRRRDLPPLWLREAACGKSGSRPILWESGVFPLFAGPAAGFPQACLPTDSTIRQSRISPRFGKIFNPRQALFHILSHTCGKPPDKSGLEGENEKKTKKSSARKRNFKTFDRTLFGDLPCPEETKI